MMMQAVQYVCSWMNKPPLIPRPLFDLLLLTILPLASMGGFVYTHPRI